jgi:hypothetical protein
MSAAEIAMRVELTFSNGMKQTMEAQKVLFVLPCHFENCDRGEFKSPDPRQKYCDYKCSTKAANLRKAMKAN